MKLSLIVIYTNQLFEMQAFYESLGLHFKKEQHGSGPEHFSCYIAENIVLELYPGKKSSTDSYRLEFKSGEIPEISKRLIKNGWSQNMGFRTNAGSLYLIDPDNNEVMINPPKFPIK